jgi:hypothetical protein
MEALVAACSFDDEAVEDAIREALDKLGLREQRLSAHQAEENPSLLKGEQVRYVSDWRQVDTEPASFADACEQCNGTGHRHGRGPTEPDCRHCGGTGVRVDSEPSEPRSTRNEVTDEWFKGPGGRTFWAPPPLDYEGRVVCFEVIRLGDHAHIEVSTGRQHANGPSREPTYHKGVAGRLVFAWGDWVHLRDALDAIPWVWLAEVEEPTPAQVDRYIGPSATSEGEPRG